MPHDGELDAVDGLEFVRGEAEGFGGEGVDFDEDLAAGVVGTEGVVPVPMWGQGGPVVGEARVLARPSVLAEGVDGEHGLGIWCHWELRCACSIPEVGVVDGEATEAQQGNRIWIR